MCGCEHHWDENAPCTCLCPGHHGVRYQQERQNAVRLERLQKLERERRIQRANRMLIVGGLTLLAGMVLFLIVIFGLMALQ